MVSRDAQTGQKENAQLLFGAKTRDAAEKCVALTKASIGASDSRTIITMVTMMIVTITGEWRSALSASLKSWK